MSDILSDITEASSNPYSSNEHSKVPDGQGGRSAPGGQTLKLWLMMFFEFFIFGAWLPMVTGYLGALGFSAAQITSIMVAFPISAISSVFFSNQFADRNFAAEKFLAFSHVVGGLAMLGMYLSDDYWVFLICMWIHCLFYVPTISIANSIAFAALKDAKKEFGIVRLGGTIGWIAVSWPLVFLLGSEVSSQANAFLLAAIASLLLAGFSLTLPHTPANPESQSLAWLDAFKMLGKPFLLVLWLVTFLDAAIHDLYFLWTWDFLGSIGVTESYRMPVMSIGQVAEIATMAVLAYFLTRLGWKKTMILGILGHTIRFGIFAFAPSLPLVIAGILLHGICYAFFFATIYIFVDEVFPKNIRSSAQGLFNIMILGGGPLLARAVGPWLMDLNRLQNESGQGQQVDFRSLFQYPMWASLVAAVILAVAFWPPKNEAEVGANRDPESDKPDQAVSEP